VKSSTHAGFDYCLQIASSAVIAGNSSIQPELIKNTRPFIITIEK